MFCLKISFVLFSIFQLTAAATTCGDWEPYKNEYCFKVFPKLNSFADAQALCKANDASSLAVIHYAEEQNFISDFLFKHSKLVNSVWIGAKNTGANSYHWNDGSDMTVFSNWAPGHPLALPNYCVEMSPDVKSVGKWLSEPCQKNNTILCQKRAPVNIPDLSATVQALEHNLESLQRSLAEMKEKMTALETNEVKHVLPPGFIYVQIPGEAAPERLWPGSRWTDVSSQFAGVFFRVDGGEAKGFGNGVQEANSGSGIAAISVENYTFDVHANATVQLKAGQWSERIFTGTANPNEPPIYQYSWKVQSIGGENRPKNVAVKVWKKTG